MSLMLLWRRSCRKFSSRRLACRAVVSLLLLNWIVLTVGIPLPLPVAKDRSQPFPCMDSQCGCNSAAACWKSCCCHTDTEKVLWARRKGVTPPAFVVAAAKREAVSSSGSESSTSSSTSCCKQTQQSCCTKEESQSATLAKVTKALHKDSAKKCSHSTLLLKLELPTLELPKLEMVAKQSDTEEPDSNSVTLSSLLSCQGISVAGQLDIEALPSSPEMKHLPWGLAGAWVALQDQQPLEVSILPPVPPPQMAC